MRDEETRCRKKPAHPAPINQGNRTIIVFVTVCSRKRRPLFASAGALELITTAWQKAEFWRVGRFVLLPDHIHFFCAPGTWPMHPLSNWMSFWQNLVTREWPDQEQRPLWQRDWWDRQIRHGESYGTKWEYVRNNPVRHGLVSQPEKWPYQGELNVLDWHDE